MRLSVTAGLAVSFLAAPISTLAHGYPVKPIRVVLPYAPGGGTDILTRLIGHKLSESLGQWEN
jgi:tripartite-type tricarboxylate transporter receptor subunit TctC